MADKQNCYYIIPRIPYPAVGGDRLKYFNSIKVLSAKYNLHIIIVSDEKLTSAAEIFLNQYSTSFKVFYYKKIHFLLNAFFGLFNKLPLQVNYYFFKEIKNYCAAVIKPGDIVIANLIRTALYAIDLPNKKLLNFEDSIYLNYKASIKKVASFFWRLIYKVELKPLQKFELRCIEKFDYTTFVNIIEQQYYSKYSNTFWLPNGVSDDLCTRIFNTGIKYNEVAYLGKMDYQPNVDAVVWFANNVISKYPDIKLKIIGAKPNKTVLGLKEKYPDNISITGYVDDPFEIMKQAIAVVAPMQTGGGLQNKILEAMAIGCVVLTSQLGATPIKGAKAFEHLLICDKAEDYKALIEKVKTNEEYATGISINARKFIVENYTWHIYGKRLFTLLDKMI